MSKHNDAANAVAELVKVQGNRNGQRWLVDVGELAALLEDHYPAPAPKPKAAPKKKATKKKAGDDGQSSAS